MNIETANRLAELRKKSGLSQEELADKLGLSRQAVSKWERAESSPDTDNLILLAKLYNISLDELLKTDKPVDEIIKDNQDDLNEGEKEQEVKEEKEKTKKKDHVSISTDGIHVESEDGDSVHIGKCGIHINDKDYHEYIDDKNHKRHKVVGLLNGVFFACAILTYILLGLFWKAVPVTTGEPNAGWAVGWIVFLLAPIIPSIVDAIWKKRLGKVNFFCMGLSAYLYLGMMLNLWHPWWCLIVVVVIMHIVISSIEDAIYGHEHHDHKKDESITIDLTDKE